MSYTLETLIQILSKSTHDSHCFNEELTNWLTIWVVEKLISWVGFPLSRFHMQKNLCVTMANIIAQQVHLQKNLKSQCLEGIKSYTHFLVKPIMYTHGKITVKMHVT